MEESGEWRVTSEASSMTVGERKVGKRITRPSRLRVKRRPDGVGAGTERGVGAETEGNGVSQPGLGRQFHDLR